MNKKSTLFNGRYITPEEREKIKQEKAKYREYNGYMNDLTTKILSDKTRTKRRMKEYKYC